MFKYCNQNKKSLFKVVNGCDEKTNKSWIVKSMLDVNPARQLGISLAANLTPKPVWILPIDGNNFFTKEVELFLPMCPLCEEIEKIYRSFPWPSTLNGHITFTPPRRTRYNLHSDVLYNNR